MKIKKSDLLNMIQEQNDVIAKLIRQVNCHHEDIIRLEGVVEPQPQLIAIRSKRDIEKELLEVDLSIELTGSELCRAMFARGATMIMCAVSNSNDQKRAITKQHEIDIIHDLESFVSSTHPYVGFQNSYRYATPINNQGEPLTAAEVGL